MQAAPQRLHDSEMMSQWTRACDASIIPATGHSAGEGNRRPDTAISIRNCGAILNAIYDATGVRIDELPVTISRLLERAAADRITIPTFEGKRGHPPLFGVDTIPCLRRAPLEAGARWVYSAHPDLVVEAETGDRGILMNMNTREEWLEAENSGRFIRLEERGRSR